MPAKGYRKQHIPGIELAKKAGVNPSFITEMRHKGAFDGCFRKKRNRKTVEYHEVKCLKILEALDVAKSKKKGKSPTSQYNLERSLLVRAQRCKVEFDQKVREGLYLETKEVENVAFKIARICRDHLTGMPARLASLCAAKSKKKEKEIYQILKKEIDVALRELIRGLDQVGRS